MNDQNALVIGLLLSISAPDNQKEECLKTVNELLDQMAAKHRAFLLSNAQEKAEYILKRPSDELKVHLAKRTKKSNEVNK